MERILRTLASGVIWLAIASMPGAALAVPIVYASAADDGTNSGIAAIAPDSVPVTINLYLDPGEVLILHLLCRQEHSCPQE